MIRAKLYVKDIDYNKIIELAMPYIVKGLSDKNNLFYDIVTGIISKNGKPSGFSKLLVTLIPNKNSLAASILLHFNEVLKAYLNEQLKKNNIAASIKSVSFETIERSYGKMLKIEITVEDIDYEQTVANLTPVILQKLSEKGDKSGKLAQLLLNLKDLPSNMLAAAIGAIPTLQRDELLADILMEYREELTDTLNKIIENNNIQAQINEIKVINL